MHVFDWKVPVFDWKVSVFDWKMPVFDWNVHEGLLDLDDAGRFAPPGQTHENRHVEGGLGRAQAGPRFGPRGGAPRIQVDRGGSPGGALVEWWCHIKSTAARARETAERWAG